jgi:hypothetical protein
MEITLSDIWGAAGFLIGLQIAAFAWRVSRELNMADKEDIIWLPLADMMNLFAMVVAFLGVFALPLAGIENSELPRISLGLSIVLFAGYPFALAGHYNLYTKGKREKADYCTKQEKTVVFITIVFAMMFLSLWFWHIN